MHPATINVAENHAKLARLLDAHPDARVVCKEQKTRRTDTWTPLLRVEFQPAGNAGDPPLIVLTFA